MLGIKLLVTKPVIFALPVVVTPSVVTFAPVILPLALTMPVLTFALVILPVTVTMPPTPKLPAFALPNMFA